MRLRAEPSALDVAVISTGSISLHAALRSMASHAAVSGKTTIALHMIAEAHKTSRIAAFIDAEQR
jgi:RecA/RadA recombinase